MLKMVLPIFLVLTVTTQAQSLKSVDSCGKDSFMSQQISQVPATDRLDILNAQSEVVGALAFESAVASTGNLAALYLCGSNPGYYYVNGTASSWITNPGQEVVVGPIYNDEYEVQAKAQTLKRLNGIASLKLQLRVKFTGDPQSADYPPFSAEVFINIPQK